MSNGVYDDRLGTLVLSRSLKKKGKPNSRYVLMFGPVGQRTLVVDLDDDAVAEVMAVENINDFVSIWVDSDNREIWDCLTRAFGFGAETVGPLSPQQILANALGSGSNGSGDVLAALLACADPDGLLDAGTSVGGLGRGKEPGDLIGAHEPDCSQGKLNPVATCENPPCETGENLSPPPPDEPPDDPVEEWRLRAEAHRERAENHRRNGRNEAALGEERQAVRAESIADRLSGMQDMLSEPDPVEEFIRVSLEVALEETKDYWRNERLHRPPHSPVLDPGADQAPTNDPRCNSPKRNLYLIYDPKFCRGDSPLQCLKRLTDGVYGATDGLCWFEEGPAGGNQFVCRRNEQRERPEPCDPTGPHCNENDHPYDLMFPPGQRGRPGRLIVDDIGGARWALCLTGLDVGGPCVRPEPGETPLGGGTGGTPTPR